MTDGIGVIVYCRKHGKPYNSLHVLHNSYNEIDLLHTMVIRDDPLGCFFFCCIVKLSNIVKGVEYYMDTRVMR